MKILTPSDFYHAVEEKLAPRLESYTHTRNFSELAALLMRTQSSINAKVNDVSTRFWHSMNLPAERDIQRLRRQVGELDRELRMLRLKLADTTAEQRAGNAKGPRGRGKTTTSARR